MGLPDFKTRMSELAAKKAFSEAETRQRLQLDMQKRKELEEANKASFAKIRRETIAPIVSALTEAFKQVGDDFKLFSEESASSLNDRIRCFAQIFCFPKGNKSLGFNSPSILFDCNPHDGTVKISMQTDRRRPSPLKHIETVQVNELNQEFVEKHISDFVEGMQQ